MDPNPKSLTTLPIEIIFEICDHLPLDGILSLTLTHIHFRTLLSSLPRAKHTTPSDCARLAIRAYLDSPLTAASHQRCILCKKLYPLSMFTSASSPACRPLRSASASTSPQHNREVIPLPHKMCAWHVARLARKVQTGPHGRNEWVSRMDVLCMHCGELQGSRCCGCECSNCSVAAVRTYTRFLNNTRECRSWAFWRKPVVEGAMGGLGELWVREVCRVRGMCDFLFFSARVLGMLG